MYEEDFKPHDTVGGIIKDNEGNILILYHEKYKLYTIPIGKVLNNEGPISAIKRELKEELNIDVRELELLCSAHIEYELNNKHLESDGVLFEIYSFENFIKNNEPDKHSTIQYVNIEGLLKLKSLGQLTELTKVYLKYLENQNHCLMQ
jgi:8-oxo-dGTP pyrophosphatase MutT (NUDIX family)